MNEIFYKGPIQGNQDGRGGGGGGGWNPLRVADFLPNPHRFFLFFWTVDGLIHF